METPTDDTSDAVTAAAGVLAAVFGPVHLDGGTPLDSSERSRVLRYRLLEGPAHAPASVIVKRAVVTAPEIYAPDQPGGPAARLFNEWASLQVLAEVAPDQPLAPRFYGGDRAAGILVMEDLDPFTDSLTAHLLGDDPAASVDQVWEWVFDGGSDNSSLTTPQVPASHEMTSSPIATPSP